MPGYILCQAHGGLNDITCQIWHCTVYALKHDKSIILTHWAYFGSDLFEIFDFSNYPVPVFSLDKLRSITYDAVEPSVSEEYVKCFLNKTANINEMQKFMSPTTSLNVFDKTKTYPETTLLFHDSCGGGLESIEFFKHIQFTIYMYRFFRDQAKNFPKLYNALHIRNTDIKTDVYPLLETINTTKLPLFIGTDDLSLKKYILTTYRSTFATSFEAKKDIVNLHYADTKYVLEWALVDLLMMVFSENTIKSSYDKAGLIIHSGFTRLIDGLKTIKAKLHEALFPKNMAVLMTFFNPCKSKRILMNFLYTYNNLKTAGIPVFAIECLFPNQTPSIGFDDIRIVHSTSYFFYKEALLRILEKSVPSQYTKFLFLDADLYYNEPNWYDMIESALDTHEVVQPYKTLNYLDLTYKNVLHSRPSYASVPSSSKNESAIGMAWAMTRSYYNRCGFYDECLLGNGDTVSAIHFTNRSFEGCDDILLNIHKETHALYSKKPKPNSVGYCDLVINHLYHGSLKNRKYWDRNFLFNEVDGDISHLMTTNEYGLFEWKTPEIKLKWNKIIFRYFSERDDDDMYEDITAEVKMELKYTPQKF